MSLQKVGGEVDGYCTKCRMTLAHTILAMVGTKVARVRCNTCHGDHAFRTDPALSSSTPRVARERAIKPTEERSEKVIIGFAERLAQKDVSQARTYNVNDTFLMDEVINHPTFGLGIVSSVRGDKVEVAFKADSKTLIHGRGGASMAKPTFARPMATATGPADKPQVEVEPAKSAS